LEVTVVDGIHDCPATGGRSFKHARLVTPKTLTTTLV
jgi:hypothetical protein